MDINFPLVPLKLDQQIEKVSQKVKETEAVKNIFTDIHTEICRPYNKKLTKQYQQFQTMGKIMMATGIILLGASVVAAVACSIIFASPVYLAILAIAIVSAPFFLANSKTTSQKEEYFTNKNMDRAITNKALVEGYRLIAQERKRPETEIESSTALLNSYTIYMEQRPFLKKISKSFSLNYEIEHLEEKLKKERAELQRLKEIELFAETDIGKNVPSDLLNVMAGYIS